MKSVLSKEVFKRYYDNKDKISVRKRIYSEKYRGKLLQKQKDYRNKRNTDFKEIQKSYVELQNKLKNMEENFKTNDSEND